MGHKKHKRKGALGRRYGHARAGFRGADPTKAYWWQCTNKACHDYHAPVHSVPGGGGYLACDRCGGMMKNYGAKKPAAQRRGHAWAVESVITQPSGGGKLDVFLVDAHGTPLRTLARNVPPSKAREIINQRPLVRQLH